MSTVNLTMYGNGIYQDPEDENLFYLAPRFGEEGVQSPFLMPSLTRFFVVPDQVVEVLKENKGKIKSGKNYARYRGIWDVCPQCYGENSCSAVYLKSSNVHITHCESVENFGFGICSARQFLKHAFVTHIREQELSNRKGGM